MELDKLNSRRVFHYFRVISSIPHGSGNTKALSDWCLRFAKSRSLEARQDAAGNLLIRKAPSADLAGAPPLILQGHLDMVCEKDARCGLDMEKDGLCLRTGGDRMWAEGTTLGADNGIGVAMILAVLEDDTLSRPPLEAILTVDEETGMLGAAALDPAEVRGRRMINLDMDREGVVTVSCAGTAALRCTLPLRGEIRRGTLWTLTLAGLSGGHSGLAMRPGKAMAVPLLAEILSGLRQKTDLRLVSLRGGEKSNVIPEKASAQFFAGGDLRGAAAELELAGRYARTDPGLSLALERREGCEAWAAEAESGRAALELLTALPAGVLAMSPDFENLVQTSVNLSLLSAGESGLSVTCSGRSSVQEDLETLGVRISKLAERLGGKSCPGDSGPAWPYRENSPLRELLTRAYLRQFGEKPAVEGIHAGLECSLFVRKIPGLDCVSIGPDLYDIHTCREQVSISSVERVWELLLGVLAQAE